MSGVVARSLVRIARSRSALYNQSIRAASASPLGNAVKHGGLGLTSGSRYMRTKRLRGPIVSQVRGFTISAVPNTADLDNPSEKNLQPVDYVRNVAIIAHVDHGKTTLVDRLLRQAGATVDGDRVMDSNVLEQERGITILAKCTSIQWKGYHINIVDTPGHADFGGEVERIMHMVDGVILLVDATEGPMTQTKFVLAKALKCNLRPLVVLNKVDRPTSRVVEVQNEVFDLFVNLDATDDQLEFPILYASAKQGWAVRDLKDERTDMTCVLDAVLDYVPPPLAEVDAPFAMVVSMLEHDAYLGRILTGRIFSGSVKTNGRLLGVNSTGDRVEEGRVLKVIRRAGMERVFVDGGSAGDIISVAGLTKCTVSDTLCDPLSPRTIPTIPIDPPTIAITVSVNDSPLAGQEGTHVTAGVIRDRLMRECESNITISIAETADKDAFEVRGRGELQLGVLLENLRREGFELSVSPPRVVLREEGGVRLEPIEEVFMEVTDDLCGVMIDRLSARKGELVDMKPQGNGRTQLHFYCPSRGLIGFQSQFKTDTRGDGVINRLFHSYEKFKGGLDRVRKGALISMDDGPTTAYALNTLEARGVLFVPPQMRVYQGMIIGEHTRENDLEVNPVKQKRLTNVRAAGSEEAIRLTPPRLISLEDAIGYINEDEILEVTPKNIRLRKRILDSSRRRSTKRSQSS